MDKKITIGIVIPSFNRKLYLESLLNQINNQILPEDLIIQTIVVIDGSTDGTYEMLEIHFPNVDVVKGTGNWWFTKSLNEGCKAAAKAGTDYILTLNDDCSIDNYLVANLYRDYHIFPENSIIGAITVINSNPCRVTFSGTKKFSKMRVKLTPYLDKRKEIRPEELTGIYPTYTLMTRGLLFTTQTGEKLNFFDDIKFPQYGSDDDFILRAKKTGMNAYVSWNVKIYDEPLLTSIGSAITRPKFNQFIKSFFNKYSINSISKTIKFQERHGYRLVLPVNIIIFLFGTFYAYLWKYRKKNI